MSDGRMPQRDGLGLDRLQALFAWWGFPTNERSNSAPPLAALSDTIANLQRGYVDAFSRNMDTMLAVNDRLSRAAAELLRAKTMSDVSQVQDAIYTALSEAVATHTENWSDFRRVLVEAMGEGWGKRAAAPVSAAPAKQVPISVAPAAAAEAASQQRGKAETRKPLSASAA